MTIVIGIDPSLTATGIATPKGVTTIRSEGKKNATLRERAARLHDLAMDIGSVVDTARRDGDIGEACLVVIERQIATAGGHAHDRSGLWWLIVDEFFGSPNVDVVEVVSQHRMMYATGTGRADKDEVLAKAITRYPTAGIGNNNEADAFIFRAMGCDAIGEPIAVVPKSHRRALEKPAWPSYVHLEQP